MSKTSSADVTHVVVITFALKTLAVAYLVLS